MIQKAAIHTGNILDESSCAHLASNSVYSHENKNGTTCPKDTKHAGEKMSPLFTCDITSEKTKGSSDNANWMAIPKSRFKLSKCDQDLVICANKKFTHATVRDKSEIAAW